MSVCALVSAIWWWFVFMVVLCSTKFTVRSKIFATASVWFDSWLSFWSHVHHSSFLWFDKFFFNLISLNISKHSWDHHHNQDSKDYPLSPQIFLLFLCNPFRILHPVPANNEIISKLASGSRHYCFVTSRHSFLKCLNTFLSLASGGFLTRMCKS